MSSDNNDIVRLLNLNIEDIYFELGQQAIDSSQIHFYTIPSRDQIINHAKKWFRDNHENIMVILCKNDRIKRLIIENEEIALATAIVDLISGITIGVSPATVAVLLTKKGLKKLCSEM